MTETRYRPPRTLRSRALIYWYRVRIALASRRWWWRTSLLLGTWLALGWPVYEKNVAQGLLHTVFAILMVGGRAFRYAAPREMEIVEHEYLARKAGLYSLLKRMSYRASMSEREIASFQHDALRLIASYVRGYRSDLRGTEIFVSLVVEDGADLVVIARNHDQRPLGVRYPKVTMVAWDAMLSGEAAVVGDLKKESPHVDKRYRSIMAVPIMNERGAVVGAVSIDSLKPHDFDTECDKLVPRLAPYVCLLGWTLIHAGPRLSGAGEKTAVVGAQDAARVTIEHAALDAALNAALNDDEGGGR